MGILVVSTEFWWFLFLMDGMGLLGRLEKDRSFFRFQNG